MNSSDLITRIGEQFGNGIAQLIRSVRAFAVTVERIDGDKAYVSLFSRNSTMPVPLTPYGIKGTLFKITPAVGSLAVISFMNGDENTPFFVAFSQVDECLLTVGESKIKITDELIEFNGGTLKGLVAIDALTQRLNKLQSEVNAVVQRLNTHVHVSNGVVLTAPFAQTVSSFSNNDYINEKITQ